MSRIFVRLLCVAFSFVSMEACAQQSLFQSASGDSTIYLPKTMGVLSYNLGSDQARFDFNYDSFAPGRAGGDWSFGGGVGGTIKKGTGTIVNNNAPANGAFGEVGTAWRFSLHRDAAKAKLESCVQRSTGPNGGGSVRPGQNSAGCHEKDGQFLVGQFHYGYSTFYNLPTATAPVPTPTKMNFNEYRGTIALNLLRTSNTADWRIGAAYVLGNANNLADLSPKTYQAQIITTTSSGQSVLNSPSKDVYVGPYTTYTSQQINADVVYQPRVLSYQIAVDALLRSDLGGGPGVRYESPGVGVFFFTKGKPVVPVCGVTYTYQAGNNQLSVTAGWSFGGAQ